MTTVQKATQADHPDLPAWEPRGCVTAQWKGGRAGFLLAAFPLVLPHSTLHFIKVSSSKRPFLGQPMSWECHHHCPRKHLLAFSQLSPSLTYDDLFFPHQFTVPWRVESLEGRDPVLPAAWPWVAGRPSRSMRPPNNLSDTEWENLNNNLLHLLKVPCCLHGQDTNEVISTMSKSSETVERLLDINTELWDFTLQSRLRLSSEVKQPWQYAASHCLGVGSRTH